MSRAMLYLQTFPPQAKAILFPDIHLFLPNLLKSILILILLIAAVIFTRIVVTIPCG
ncbi:hypothetical protein P389DRAFT_175073 [Cystobasidium minutum MCA 4210]|uniref:uncharacterized protein n=1 Tax=Cystobasidium minutum MCA 4210 TaxID=1397322 RepID=UPI0034CEC8C3|eukprot:jgi/Rhomi1/175073/fgenesh1_kg.9_\